jgi:hypothetical protein
LNLITCISSRVLILRPVDDIAAMDCHGPAISYDLEIWRSATGMIAFLMVTLSTAVIVGIIMDGARFLR